MPSVRTSGVSLRYSTAEEYVTNTATEEQTLRVAQQVQARPAEEGPGGKVIAASVYKNMKSISKKKEEEGEAKYPKALIMSLFEDEDVKKAIRVFVSAAGVVDVVSTVRDTETNH
eukprot:1754838-Ditylum_brightwellii.AAC.1